MTTSKEQLTNNQTITITLASLASATYRQSAAIDNTSNLFTNAASQLVIKTGASGTSATGSLSVYAYASMNGGTNYSGGASGSDAAYTADVTGNPNLFLLGNIAVSANATSYTFRGADIAAAIGYVPSKWGIVVLNNTGHALDVTGGNFSAYFEGNTTQTA